MTLQQIAQILGGIGVIASMIYAGIPIRNNARAFRASTYQQISVISMQAWFALAHNGGTTAARGCKLQASTNFTGEIQSAKNQIQHRVTLPRRKGYVWPLSRTLDEFVRRWPKT